MALIDFSTKEGLVLEWLEETEIMEWCFKESVESSGGFCV